MAQQLVKFQDASGVMIGSIEVTYPDGTTPTPEDLCVMGYEQVGSWSAGGPDVVYLFADSGSKIGEVAVAGAGGMNQNQMGTAALNAIGGMTVMGQPVDMVEVRRRAR